MFSEKPTRPITSGKNIKLKQYNGHTDPNATGIIQNKIEKLNKEELSDEKTAKSQFISISDVMRAKAEKCSST
jgi:hypothetical protein